MKIAFFVSSAGDTDLALKTIQALEQKSQHETVLVSLTKSAQQRVDGFQSGSLVSKQSITDILQLNSESYPEKLCTEEQLIKAEQYIHHQNIDYAYFGVPSVNNEIPFQLAESLTIPVLMAYEFMFKSEAHCLWKHIPVLNNKSNVKWALPLVEALEDFEIEDKSKLHITGHLSIDNAYSPSVSTKNPEEIKNILQVPEDKSLAFMSSTTQPVAVDSGFLDCLLTELKQHPHMQVRLGLHPGIQDFDTYLSEILAVYQEHVDISGQFKIILPDNLVGKIKYPELTIDAPRYQNVFLRVNVTGAESASAADRITQAVPGALLNQAVLEGKPSYSHAGKPYLPRQCFSTNIASFFTATRQTPRLREDLGLDSKTAPERYAEIIMG